MKKSLSISSHHHAQAIRKFFNKSRILKNAPHAPHTDTPSQHDENQQRP